jgi:hypothetical protein
MKNSVILFLFFAVSMLAQTHSFAQTLPQTNPSSAPSSANQEPKTTPQKIPDEYLQESMAIHDECVRNAVMNENYECECLAAKFLDTRTERGPSETKEALLLDLQKECRKSTGASGKAYNNCIQSAGMMPPGTDPEALCSCVGNTYAKMLDRDKPVMTQESAIYYQTQARVICDNPDLARRMGYIAPK